MMIGRIVFFNRMDKNSKYIYLIICYVGKCRLSKPSYNIKTLQAYKNVYHHQRITINMYRIMYHIVYEISR